MRFGGGYIPLCVWWYASPCGSELAREGRKCAALNQNLRVIVNDLREQARSYRDLHRSIAQPMMIVPTAITTHASTLRTVNVSPKKKYPINAANNTLVSRNADTAPIGAPVMA